MTVTVELFGLPADSHRVKSSSAHRVRASSANFFNVAYSDSGFTFKKVLFSKDRIKIEIEIIIIILITHIILILQIHIRIITNLI